MADEGMALSPTLMEDQHVKLEALQAEDMEVDAQHEVDDIASARPKKKRRIIKPLDKKYDCPNPECGKSYSRAEHLYRHQLNRECLSHTMKIYPST